MAIKLEDEDYISFLNDQNVHEDEIKDPMYKIFLEHLSKDGSSYVFEMENGDNGLPTTIKYEGEDDLSEKNDADTKTSSGKINISFEGRDNSLAKKVQKKNRSCPKSGEAAVLSSIPNRQSEPEESYVTFLNHLKFKESSMIFEFDSVSITYEEEKETPISSEIVAAESNVNSLVPYSSTEPSNITVYEDGDSSMVSLDCYELTDFKSKLMAVLSKPYNQAEYEELLKKASERKPLNKQKHLRSMSISYATKEVGQSYFDHFPDLAEQVRSADCEMRLNLLRGFFFWLKNLTQEGAYMPWASSGYEVIATDDCEVVLPLDIARD